MPHSKFRYLPWLSWFLTCGSSLKKKLRSQLIRQNSKVRKMSVKIISIPHSFVDFQTPYTHTKMNIKKKYPFHTFYCSGCFLPPPLSCTHTSTQLSILKRPFPHGNMDELATPCFLQVAPPPGFLNIYNLVLFIIRIKRVKNHESHWKYENFECHTDVH